MFLSVSLDDGGSPPALHDVGDLSSLKVVVHGDDGDLADALAGVGYVGSSGDAFLDIAALLALAGKTADAPGWRAEFDAMVEYARSKGWVDAPGRALQAHCEPRSPAR